MIFAAFGYDIEGKLLWAGDFYSFLLHLLIVLYKNEKKIFLIKPFAFCDWKKYLSFNLLTLYSILCFEIKCFQINIKYDAICKIQCEK